MDRKEDGLKALGAKTQYRMDYAPEVLETFVNKHPGNDYWVRFNCPEFTSLCPITGQPDFAEIRISYIPDVKIEMSLPSFFIMGTEDNPRSEACASPGMPCRLPVPHPWYNRAWWHRLPTPGYQPDHPTRHSIQP